MRTSLWIFSALLLFLGTGATNAHADETTQSYTGTTEPLSVTFTGFDTSLGTLNDITYKFSFFETLGNGGSVTVGFEDPIPFTEDNIVAYVSPAGFVAQYTDDTNPGDLAIAIAGGFLVEGYATCSDPANCESYTASYSITYDYTPTVTPEPASMLLFGTGMLGIIFVLRKRLFA